MHVLLVLLFSSFLFASTAEIEEKKEIIRSIVDSYRDDIIRKRGSDVNLTFPSADIFQMTGGHIGGGKLVIKVYAGALTKFDKEAIVAATCHELGHILGEVPVGGSSVVSEDSVEGEADYFSGICSRNYFCGLDNVSCAPAISASRSVLKAMIGTEAQESEAVSLVYPGVNKTYPEPACRLLSMISGVTGQARPLCWFNPNYKPKAEPKIYLEQSKYFRKDSSCLYLTEHLGETIKQTAFPYLNRNCRENGQIVMYQLVPGHSNIYQASSNDLLKVKGPTSFQFAQNVELLELGKGFLYETL